MANNLAVLILALMLSGCRIEEETHPGGEAREPASKSGRVEADSGSGIGQVDSIRSLRKVDQSRLQTSYKALRDSLESLWGDTVDIDVPSRAGYRRILEKARTVQDNTEVHLEELLVSTEAVTPEIWEDIRARSELSLDSLRRLFRSADSLRVRKSTGNP